MANQNLSDIWIYLSASPLAGLTLTLLAYGLAFRLYQQFNNNPLLHPVVIAATLIIGFLLITDTAYDAYFEGGQFVHFLLGPATVALAIPLYQQWSKIKKLWLPLSITVVGGVLIAGTSAIVIAQILGASLETQLSLAPKSVTAPVAMAISEQLNGFPSLTAVLVVTTGILGAVIGTKILSLIRVKDDAVKGMAMGITAHGIGTARAFQVSKEMGSLLWLGHGNQYLCNCIDITLVGQLFFINRIDSCQPTSNETVIDKYIHGFIGEAYASSETNNHRPRGDHLISMQPSSPSSKEKSGGCTCSGLYRC